MKTGRHAGSRAPGGRARFTPLVLALLLAGCTVGPDYHTPPLSGTKPRKAGTPRCRITAAAWRWRAGGSSSTTQR